MESLKLPLLQKASQGTSAEWSMNEITQLAQLVGLLHSHVIVLTKRISHLEKLRRHEPRGISNSVAAKEHRSKSREQSHSNKTSRQSPERGRSMHPRSTSPASKQAGQSTSGRSRSKSMNGLFKGMSVQEKEFLKQAHKRAYKKIPKANWINLSHEDRVVEHQRRKAAIAEYRSALAKKAEKLAEKKKFDKESRKLDERLIQDSKNSNNLRGQDLTLENDLPLNSIRMETEKPGFSPMSQITQKQGLQDLSMARVKTPNYTTGASGYPKTTQSNNAK
jgi:hypothetical protein